MHTFHPEVAAAVLAAELAEMHPSAIGPARLAGQARRPGSPARLDYFAARIEAVLRGAMAAEREACAALCVQRQTLWEKTENADATLELLRAESRFRGNEAAYLADVIRERAGGEPAAPHRRSSEQ
jgi:hypothetical protein